MAWKELSEDFSPDAWDRALVESVNPTVFQCSKWAQFRKQTGWLPLRLQHSDGSQVQVLQKPFPFGVTLSWAPGGPAFKKSNPDRIQKSLVDLADYIKGQRGFQFWRIKPHLLQSDLPTLEPWRRPLVPLTSSYTVLVPTGLNEAEFLKGLTSKHRYYLKKAKESRVEWRWTSEDQDLDVFLTLFSQMENLKGLGHISIRKSDLLGLRDTFRNNFLLLLGYHEGLPVVGCVCLVFGPTAFYYFAATAALGREIGASYLMVETLIGRLRAMGVQFVDLGGVDLDDPRTKGVVHFKKGFTGELSTFLGELELSHPGVIRWPFNLAMKYRRRRL